MQHHIPMKSLIAGIQNKTNVLMAIAAKDDKQREALQKRITELQGVIECLGLADQPSYQAVNWVKNHQIELAEELKRLKG